MKASRGIKGKLDKLVGSFFRSRPCDFSLIDSTHKCKGRLEWCHIKTRKYLLLRWDFFNNLTLCSERHFYFTANPDEFIHWVDKYFPGRTEYLNKKMMELRTMKKSDLEELYKNKKEELE
jgi:hypothetical protein